METTCVSFPVGDAQGAIVAAERSIDVGAEKNERFRAAAYYSAGVLHFVGRRHDVALEIIDAAAAVDPDNEIVAKAAGEARRAVAPGDRCSQRTELGDMGGFLGRNRSRDVRARSGSFIALLDGLPARKRLMRKSMRDRIEN